MPPSSAPKWPKTLPPLTPEQVRISDDFMKLWHEVLPRRFGLVETFNHNFPVRHSPSRASTRRWRSAPVSANTSATSA